ncbi:MAG: universal stress protein, partial [Myxococcota bacterium]
WAQTYVRKVGGSIVLVHTLDPVVAVPTDMPMPPPLTVEELGAIEESVRVAARAQGAVVEAEVVLASSPGSAIVDAAIRRGATAICVGTHGRTGLARLVLGSVAETVIRRATIPVIVLKA